MPNCRALHEFLISLGYQHVVHEADWYDAGDAENGPKLDGGPGYDEYVAPDGHHVYYDEAGRSGEEMVQPEEEVS